MTGSLLRSLPRVVFTAALVLAAVFACSEEITPPPEQSPVPVQVQAAWQDVRALPGHEVHVVQRQLACDACHTLTDTVFDKPSPERCRTCHEKHSDIQHAPLQAQQRFGETVGADCTVCHAFTRARPESAVGSAWDCQRCHNSGVAAIQGGQSGPPGPPSEGAATAIVGHSTANCQSCHAPHEQPPIKAPDCSSCHADITLSHGATPHGFSMACGQCHSAVHAPAGASKACQSCHEEEKPVVASAKAVFPGGHDTCTTCHVPHDFGEGVKTCSSCHSNPPALAADRVKAHNDCRNCHTPHDVRANPNQACKSCHSSLKNDHPAQPSQHECTTCHQGHPTGGKHGLPSMGATPAHGTVVNRHHSLAIPCSSCHEATNDQAFHGTQTACIQCHKPHQFKVSLKQRHLCQSCHAEQLTLCAQSKGHKDCKTCHTGLPHDVSSAPVGCDACHGKQAQAVTEGHQACAQCHEPHSGTLTRACSDCHQVQHETAPAGHRNCRSCHDAHSGDPRSNVSCATCHTSQAAGVHGNLDTGCGTCHRPHGPQGLEVPPDCGSCHAPTQLPALHRVTQHQNCGQCHKAHDVSPFAQRETCLSCHTNMTNHYPTTNRCSSCHLFKGL